MVSTNMSFDFPINRRAKRDRFGLTPQRGHRNHGHMVNLALSDPSRIIAGVIFITVPTIEFGGYYLTRVVRGHVPLTEFQKSFARAGHAHAGVIVILGLVGLIVVDAAGMNGFWAWVGRLGIPIAAIGMPAGFFAS